MKNKQQEQISGQCKPSSAFEHIDWSQYISLLGKIYDNKLAEMIGCSPALVARKRKELGIEPYLVRPDWSQWDHLIGTMPDTALAKKMGICPSSVWSRRKKLGLPANREGKEALLAILKKRRDISRYDSLLGTMPDPQLSEIIGCSTQIVWSRRKKLNIPPFSHTKNIKTDEIDSLLGLMPDKALARKIGCSITKIFHRRKELGISAFRKHSK
jgi:predicted Rdx family selenoprotein